MSRVALVARCPEHGLHGQRADCHACGGPVEQVPMVEFRHLAVLAVLFFLLGWFLSLLAWWLLGIAS